MILLNSPRQWTDYSFKNFGTEMPEMGGIKKRKGSNPGGGLKKLFVCFFRMRDILDNFGSWGELVEKRSEPGEQSQLLESNDLAERKQ